MRQPQPSSEVSAAGSPSQEKQELQAQPNSPQQLAERHAILKRGGDSTTSIVFMRRLRQQEALLQQAHERFVQASRRDAVLSYAAEWFLDNYYLLQRTYNQIQEDFSTRYYGELPKLADEGALQGYPRIFDIARELVTSENCELDEQRVRHFLQVYQETRALRIGELWALPIMLRIVLLEAILQAAQTGAADEPESEALAPPQAFELGLELRDEDIVATCIPALRVVLEQDWKAFFESVSRVDRALRSEPAQTYAMLDFETRDLYRKRVESLAAGSAQEEVAVAESAVHMAEAYLRQTGLYRQERLEMHVAGLELPPEAHVGYYLIGDGRAQLKKAIGYKPRLGARITERCAAHPTFVYLGSISLGTALVLLAVAYYLAGMGVSLPLLALSALLLLIPALSVVVSLVNWVVMQLVPPTLLPKVDFSEGIPDRYRTFVVIPSMLSDESEVESLLRQLEGHYLRNPDENLRFALLTDFGDARQEQMPGDSELLERARDGIQALNQAYPHAPFFLFHRRRVWNEQEGMWMGWERKRGKLHEFSRLLRGADDTSFEVQIGETESISGVKYVITLDADTILPQDSAAVLAGAMAHPLNRAQFDSDSGRVVNGYTILQPRTEIQPPWDRKSLFTRVFAGDTGLDLYSRAVSDVYQDLFGEGIYVGKGIYDVDAFERSLRGRVPENSLLSHDLFEGIQGRAGLITDVILYEDYPPHYLAQVRRTHRWVRGDWQLLPWLLPLAPAEDGWQPNRLALIDLWKIADNLRRSLLAPSLLILLLAGWTVLPGSPLMWTIAAILTPAISLLTGVLSSIMRLSGTGHVGTTRSLRDSFLRWLMYVAFLPYEATLNADAILSTLVRLLFTRRNLLQWTTASHTTRLFGDDVSADLAWHSMFSTFLLSAVMGLLVFFVNPPALPVALPLLLLWSLSPELAYLISRPEPHEVGTITQEENRRLRRLARRSWFFFERFVGPDDNWLPPDNFQEDPKDIVAHRTSPTNIGLYLLSAVAAHDFGYIDTPTLMLRLRSSFTSLQHLERYRGHFLNWYTTNTLVPLPPRYVSTVDSGNLAGCLIALQQALVELPEAPVWRWARWEGFLDTIDLLVESLSAVDARDELQAIKECRQALEQEIVACKDAPSKWPELRDEVAQRWMPQLEQRLVELIEAVQDSATPQTLQDWRLFMQRATEHLQNMRREQELLAPWFAALHNPPALFARSDLEPPMLRSWQAVQAAFGSVPSLRDAGLMIATGRESLDQLRALLAEAGSAAEVQEAVVWASALDERLESAYWLAQSIVAGCADMKQQAARVVEEMDFRFLFNRQRQVFHIGYNLDAGMLDNNYYDLLASEARISSLVAIAKNDVPSRHWLHLNRPVTSVQGRRTLLSWSGTMFEYLMPPLLLPRYRSTLLDNSAHNAISHQIAYAARRDAPWGVSESGFYSFDAAMNYQYRAFGVPGLGFKRGLGEDMVVAPYASLLALSFRPNDVLANLDRFDAMGMKGRYGYYEAVDFTKSRLPTGATEAIVYSYMAHHQGMILLALANFLKNESMVRRFHADSRIRSVDLLLQEQVPLAAPLESPHQDDAEGAAPERVRVPTHPWSVPWQTPMPAVHHLSNGRYSIMFTNAGGGYSSWRDLALTRWRPDTTLDNWGQWLYVEDCDSGAMWSATMQPALVEPSGDLAIDFFPHKVQWRRRDHHIVLQADVFVAPDDDVEVRRFRFTNDSDRTRRLRLTSYAEVVLGDAAADRRHQAFSKLFVESEYLAPHEALLFRRRQPQDQEQILMAHTLFVPQEDGSRRGAPVRYETDRLRFLGRNRSPHMPQALASKHWLSGTTGATLDPIMSLGTVVELDPYDTVELIYITVVGQSAQEIDGLLERYRSAPMLNRSEELSRSRAEYELQRLELGSPTLALGQQMLSLLIYPHPARRPAHEVLAANRKGQPGLWAYGVSGDHPILVLSLHDETELALLQEVLRIHGYWYNHGLKIDLLILNDEGANYGQVLQNFIFRSIRRAGAAGRLQRRGGIFIISREQIGADDLRLLQAAARVWLDGAQGTLSQQLQGLYEPSTRLPALEPTGETIVVEGAELSRPDTLLFDNGYGGFSADGKEYVVYLAPGQSTPAPWINVIANPKFGFIVSESGGGFTWSENSGENRLTAWRNDPVTDEPAEALYLRDEETVEVWSPMPQPAPADAPYLVRHGAGYSIFEHNSHALKQETRLFAAVDAPIKIVSLRLENLSQRQRRITATYYVEWVLGSGRETTQQYLIPEYVAECHAFLVRNPYNVEFAGRVAFLATGREPHGVTAGRTEFLGRLGSMQRPAALQRVGLENDVRAGFDTCGAIQIHVDLAPGETETVYFLLGQGVDRDNALQLVGRFQQPEAATAAWQEARQHWDTILNTVQVETPDKGMDLLLNRWLLYQALSCRIWGRSALYQSSGAYGFRDQLQDVMALVHARPHLAREHILRAARHQFEEGDVLHWWHPPSGRGVRTRISDDLLWLPHVTAHYVQASGDTAILDEELPFLTGKILSEDEEERYGHYEHTGERSTLFEHCVRALYKGMTRGPRGLPLMGAGDWNDGMNRVGIEGQGESVWLGWFLYDTLQRFADLCAQVGNDEYASSFRDAAAQYRRDLESAAWDGSWYRRAYYDDGDPLGSRQNEECQIDAIAQSWSVLSGGGDPERQAQAMEAVDLRLIDRGERLMLLFTPPFDDTKKNPGYIKGYPPGIRENGGQYTHAALWTIWAFAEMGQGEKAEALFRLINPIYHAATLETASRYKVEPYVVAADVYSVAQHKGRGGWTWYTGSSGWMYRLGLEAILGLKREGAVLRLKPAIPPDWPGYAVVYRFGSAIYHIEVGNEGEQSGATVITLDGERLGEARIPLGDDGQEHQVHVRLGCDISDG